MIPTINRAIYRQTSQSIVTLNASRTFMSTGVFRSNIGKQPIRLGQDVQCSIEEIPFEFCKSFTKGRDTITLDQQVVIKGPKGVLKLPLPKFVKIENTDQIVSVTVENPQDKLQRTMWGTARALLYNNVVGTTDGHLAIVKFVGTGYRALLEKDEQGKDVVALKVGYPFTPKLPVPEGLTVTSPNPTRLLVEGLDKQQVKLFAARIKQFKKPEQYKGKGIYVDDQTIKLKEKKIK